jgi:WD40 repeat protein
LASGSDDKTIRVWDVSKGITLKTLTGHTERVLSLVVLPDGSLTSGSYDGSIRVWDFGVWNVDNSN